MENLLKTSISACSNNIIAILKLKYASTYQEEAEYILVTLHRGDPIYIKNIWKKFPEILLGHYPNLRNFKFYLKSWILEKVSGKSPETLPGFF